MSVNDVEEEKTVVNDDANVWVDRTAEARELADFILSASEGLVVLYGRYSVGKTSLIKRYVMRVLPDEYETHFDDAAKTIQAGLEVGDRRLSLQDALKSKRIIFLDRFERYLDGTEDDGAPLEQMSEFLRSPERQGILILVMDDAGLEKVLSASVYLPQLLSATREIHGVDIRQGFRTLLGSKEAGALEYDEEFLDRLSADTRNLTQAGGGCGPDVLMALVEELRNLAAEADGVRLSVKLYGDVGGVDGLLGSYMEHHIAGMYPDEPAARRIATALMLELAEQDDVLNEGALTAFSARLGEPYQVCLKIQDRLIEKSGLLLRARNRRLQFVPTELRRAISSLGRPSEQAREAYETVEQGYDAWQRLGSPLPKDRFEKIHSFRKELRLRQGFVEYLLHSIPADRERIPESRYWLRRLRDPEIRWEFLREWIESSNDSLRLRAAGLGTELPEGRQMTLLNTLAMEDSSDRVRSRALNVLLEVEGPDSLRDRLESEVEGGEHRIRGPALEALRLFHDERNRKFVRKQALNPDQSDALRAIAIETLAALELSGAVDDLRHMAMQSPDQQIRQQATEALRKLKTKEAYEQLFSEIRKAPSTVVDQDSRAGLKVVLGMALKTVAVLLLIVVNWSFHGVLLLAAGRWFVSILVFSLEGLGLWAMEGFETYELVGPIILTMSLGLGFVLPLGSLLKARSIFKLRPRSFRSILCVVLYFMNLPIFLLVHGLAHLLLGRVGRSAALFAAEVAALGAIGIVYYLYPMFYIAGATNLTDAVIYGYLGAGVILFVFSFGLDWGVVMFRDVVAFRWTEGKRRRRSLLKAVLSTPVGAETIIGWARNGDSVDKAWARGVLLEHARQVPHEALVGLLEDENPETRKFAIKSLARAKNDELVNELAERWKNAAHSTSSAIRKVMAIRPTDASVKAIRQWKREKGFIEDLRYRLTRIRFRYAYWPKSLMILATLGLPLLMLLTYHAFLAYQNEANPLVTFIVRNEKAGLELRVTVANFVADKYPDAMMTPFAENEESILRRAHEKAQEGLVQLDKKFSATDPDEVSEESIPSDDRAEEYAGPRTAFDEIVQIQKKKGERCYVRIGLGQSMAIAVYRLEKKGALKNKLTIDYKRQIFGNPLQVIEDRLDDRDGGCKPTKNEDPVLNETWDIAGNKGTRKALQALNTIVKEVPEVFAGSSKYGVNLAPSLQRLIDAKDEHHASDALRALIGIYLIRGDIKVDWGKVIDANLAGQATTDIEWARRRLVDRESDALGLDKTGVQQRSAKALAELGVELYEDAQEVGDSKVRNSMEAKALVLLDRAFTLENTAIDRTARNVMRALREENHFPR